MNYLLPRTWSDDDWHTTDHFVGKTLLGEQEMIKEGLVPRSHISTVNAWYIRRG